MKIYKIASTLGGFWITPNGKIIDVNYEGHGPYLIKHPQEFNITQNEIRNILATSPQGSAALCSLATQKGALHIGIYYGLMYIDSNSISRAEQYKQEINQIAKQFKIIPKWQVLTSESDNFAFRDKNYPVKIDTNSYKDSLPTEEPELEEVVAKNKKINKISTSTPFIHKYYSPRQKQLTPQEEHIRNIAIGLSKGDPSSINEAAQDMANQVPPNSTLVPIPNSQGNTTSNLKLAQEIAKLTNSKVLDVLSSNPRDSQKERRRQGIPGLKTDDIQTTLKNTCETNNVILIDNVRTTGATLNSAMKLLPCASYLVYAQADEILNWYEKSKI